MKFKKVFWLILVLALAGLCGCATVYDKVEPVAKVTHLRPEINQTAQVSPGGMMMQVQKGDHFTGYQLHQEIKDSVLGNSCTISPQVLVLTYQDDEFYYGISTKNFVKPSPLNWQQKAYLSTCPCGLKFSKNDLKAVAVVFMHMSGVGINKLGPGNIGDDARPVLRPVPMIDVYAPNFLRKTLKFDSFVDDFLSFRYMEERGTPNGYDAQGNLVSVPPEVSERIYEFDLQVSKIISVQGAQVDIIEAKPDRLMYKIVRPLSVE
jgi:hypothetical protein